MKFTRRALLKLLLPSSFAAASGLALPRAARALPTWEITAESRKALDRGLAWLAAHQGPSGHWGSDDLGLVSLGALAFLADGHFPGRGAYGESVRRALDFVIRSAQPSGLLNIAGPQRDMYNHGLSTFVLGQAYGMVAGARLGTTLERALELICLTQCGDGGWDYRAHRLPRGHDLSLVVMQANALRSAVDTGFEVPPLTIQLAIRNVREHYAPEGLPYDSPEALQRARPGQFTYSKYGQGGATLAMAAAGVVCLQEFGEYDDWRIEKNMEVLAKGIADHMRDSPEKPLDAYTLYYTGQAVYQVGSPWWERLYPQLCEMLVKSQVTGSGMGRNEGKWPAGRYVSGLPGELFATSVGCFVLAIANRYLPILQEGRIEAFLEAKR